MTKLSQKLDAVSKAKQAYVLARTTLEARLREQMKQELANLQTQIDIAVRYAVDAGESKASILRALGTKDYNTVKASLDRTAGVAEVVGTDPLAGVYSLVDGKLHADWDNWEATEYKGRAVFDVKKLDDGTILLLAVEGDLWNADYSVRNDVIALLDGRTDGTYYEDVVAWLNA